MPRQAEVNCNEVWITLAGRLVLIVNSFRDAEAKPTQGLAMLWWDAVDKDWNVSDLLERLYEKTEITPQEFFTDVLLDAKQGLEGDA